jgi:DNA-binding CsgD family transcriptional regulator
MAVRSFAHADANFHFQAASRCGTAGRLPENYGSSVLINKERVTLHLEAHENGLVLERTLSEAGGAELTQVFPIATLEKLDEFIAADPYRDQLKQPYGRVHTRAREHLAGCPDVVAHSRFDAGDIVAAIASIRHCVDEFSVHAILRNILPILGAESYIFTTLMSHNAIDDRESYRSLVGCRPGLWQQYNARKWHAIDPGIYYARTNSAVICLDDLPLLSHGQREFRDSCRRQGFSRGVLIPAHSGSSARFGVLYIGCEEASAYGNSLAMSNRVSLRAIAMELLEWRMSRMRDELTRDLALTERELTILRLQNRGYRALDIAAELALSAKTVHGSVKAIKDKFGAENIGAALKIADSYGLL